MAGRGGSRAGGASRSGGASRGGGVELGGGAGGSVTRGGNATWIGNGPIRTELVHRPSALRVRKMKYQEPSASGGLVVPVALPGKSATVSGSAAGSSVQSTE